jgi:hypothetical protein
MTLHLGRIQPQNGMRDCRQKSMLFNVRKKPCEANRSYFNGLFGQLFTAFGAALPVEHPTL